MLFAGTDTHLGRRNSLHRSSYRQLCEEGCNYSNSNERHDAPIGKAAGNQNRSSTDSY